MKRLVTVVTMVALVAAMVGCGQPGYTLTITSTDGGSVITPGEGTFTYDEGTVVNLVATPDSHCLFVNWGGDVVSIANVNAPSTNITMNDSYSITANFEQIALGQFGLTISSTTGGSVTEPGEGTFAYDEGTVVSLVATPDTGYRFVEWTGNVSTLADVNAAETNITMNGDYSIIADFEQIPQPPPGKFNLTISHTTGGSVTVPGEGTFAYNTGTVVSLVATPTSGYKFVNWTGNVGTIANANAASTTITMNGNYLITANFEEDDDDCVSFSDSNLEAAIREAIGKPTGCISTSDLEGLTFLQASHRNIADLTGLEHLTNLTTLYIWENQISNISPLANLTNLTVLYLSENQISDISPMANLTNLTELYLFTNQISDISPLANLTNLTLLYLAENQISDISPMANLTNLTDLFLFTNQISNISPLANLTNLTVLHLSENQISDISPLANLTNLTYLHLGSNQISDISPLANLTNLTSLGLQSNQISGISPLANLTNLTSLSLDVNQISNISPLANLTNLTYLYLWENQISNISPLANLTNLTVLLISHNQISNISPLANLTNLREVWLGHNQISNISPLANLTNLTSLSLDVNQISNISPLANLTNLTVLSLGHNQISDIYPLVQNDGLGTGDTVWLEQNPLSSNSTEIYIPQLQARGVTVYY